MQCYQALSQRTLSVFNHVNQPTFSKPAPRSMIRGPVVCRVKPHSRLPDVSTTSWTPFGWELRKKFQSKFGYTAHYLIAGKGNVAVVIIARIYRSALNALARQHTVYCFELPGCGRSDSLKTPFDLQQYADWLEYFLDHMGIANAVVIGHSCSAAPAIALAALYPRYVSHSVLVSAIGAYSIP